MRIHFQGLTVGLWLLNIFQTQKIDAFNLDTQHVLRKDGEPNSLFGFSLAMHHQLQPTDERVLLIGAPRAKALANQKANVTGGLYRCKFTAKPGDCERIQVDNKASQDLNGVDHKENQWLGVRVRSQGTGGKVLVCAHRYQKWRNENRAVLGQCLILEQDLKEVPDGYSERSFCQGRPMGKHLFGFCQQGIAADFTKDGNYLLFGAAGAYEWKGTVNMEPVDDFELDTFETGGESNGDLIPVHISSYLGFSLDQGWNLIKKGELIIVAGAPRGSYSGEVLMLQRDKREGQSILTQVHTFRGPGLASSFGYDLAVLDLNADGWDDLIVGAPEFSLTDVEKGVGGAVYVYINHAHSPNWDQIKPVSLYGKTESMFGIAVEPIGDLNQDGYQDFAVGAPYEGDGKVYLYYGSSDGFHHEPKQVLKGESHNIRLFGYSLTGNMDIDGNGYPDIVVGSLLDAVFVHRARPVINIKRTIKVVPTQIDFTKQNCKGQSCIITTESCFSYLSQGLTQDHRLTFQYKLEADVLHAQLDLPPRVVFESSSQGSYELSGQGIEKCVQTRLRLKEGIQDKLRNISIAISVSLPPERQRSTLRSSLPELQPVLDALQPEKTVAEVMFMNTGCGRDDICQSNLQLQYSFCSMKQHQDKCIPLSSQNGQAVISPGTENIALEITVTNKGGDNAHQSRLLAKFEESLPLTSVHVRENSGGEVQCEALASKTRANCQLGNPFKRDSQVTLYLMLSTEKLSISDTNASVALELETTSNQNLSSVVAMAKVVFEMDLQVYGLAKPSQVFLEGKVKGENMIKTEEEIGPLVQYEFRISNVGSPLKSFTSAMLNIHWPKEDKQGKQALYLMQITGRDQKEISCSPAEEIRPLKHIKSSHGSSRQRRQVEQESNLEALSTENGFLSFLGTKRKYKTLTCADDLKCVEIRCPLEGVDNTAVIVLRSRLWNSTFLEEYSSLNYLDVVVNASLSVDGSQKNIGLPTNQAQVRLTVFPEKKPALLTRVPWWLILLSVVTALFLLGLLIYLLLKLPHFRDSVCTKEKKSYDINNRYEENHLLT
ncbi:integrin alpha-6 [Chanos chanos]|uniref:Integrin alpha-6 n=1 Tax=Chanos chanos TaxID=29144 RepID=A0A6J2VVC5_CHACN|nr:integrin alpha-6-like [Chanos chanos]